MSTSNDFCRFAADCVKLARTAEDETDRTVYLQMAQVWVALAQKEETSADHVRTIRLPMQPRSLLRWSGSWDFFQPVRGAPLGGNAPNRQGIEGASGGAPDQNAGALASWTGGIKFDLDQFAIFRERL